MPKANRKLQALWRGKRRAKRMRNQAQYTDTSKYRTSVQQANDLAARSIKRLRKK